jgi:hypothetical protein
MAVKRGTIERITRKNGRTLLVIDGQWYSTLERLDLTEGQKVEFDFITVKKDGRTYRNLKAITPVKSGLAEESPEELAETERIARAVALKAAVASCELGTEAQAIVSTAEQFLDFLLNRNEGE